MRTAFCFVWICRVVYRNEDVGVGCERRKSVAQRGGIGRHHEHECYRGAEEADFGQWVLREDGVFDVFLVPGDGLGGVLLVAMGDEDGLGLKGREGTRWERTLSVNHSCSNFMESTSSFVTTSGTRQISILKVDLGSHNPTLSSSRTSDVVVR